VERDLEDARDEIFRDLLKQIESPDREEGAQTPGNRRGKNALDQKLHDDAGTGRAERGANGDLFAARGEAGEQKIRHVRASDQQDTADGREERQHHRPLAAHQVFVKGNYAHAGLGIDLFGIRRLIAVVDDTQLFISLLAGEALLHPAENGQVTGAALDDVGRQTFLFKNPG